MISSVQNKVSKYSRFKTKWVPILKDLGVDVAAGTATAAMKTVMPGSFLMFTFGSSPAALMYPAYRGYEGVQYGKAHAGLLGGIAGGVMGVGVGSIEGIIKSTIALASISGLSLLLRNTGFTVPSLFVGAGVGAAMFGATRLISHIWSGHKTANPPKQSDTTTQTN